jgi:hypothetical protein
MKTKAQENSLFKIMISLVLFAIFFLILGFLLYLLYENIPGEARDSIAILKPMKLESGNLSYAVKQFYPNMKFNHDDISYHIEPTCAEDKRNRMIEAFKELENRAGIINFHESSDNQADIEVLCSDEEYPIKEDYFIAGEGGAKEIIQTKRYNVINQGIILLHGNPKDSLECQWPNIELHELLHVFGFDHSLEKESIMYPYLNSCSQKLDQSIISDIKNLYSQENLPDLYFAEATAVKRGRYLDFNVSIKNSGVVKAEGIHLSVTDGENTVGDFELKDIPFGAGVNFYATNLKLGSRSSDNISLVIDKDNLIAEIDEENNIAELDFS